MYTRVIIRRPGRGARRGRGAGPAQRAEGEVRPPARGPRRAAGGNFC